MRAIALDGIPETVFEPPSLVAPERPTLPLFTVAETIVYVCGYDENGDQLFENPVSCSTTASGLFAMVDSITMEIEQEAVLTALRYKVPSLGGLVIDSTWQGRAVLTLGNALTLEFREPGRRLVTFW